jgi:DHA1 family bicyclomycin/chloramphenicol resistance-like MFS transporter
LALTVALAFLSATGPVSTDIFLPSLPAMQRAFDTDTSSVQLTLSIFMVGFAIGQVIFGPLSDRKGRRPVLIGTVLVYTVGSLACALAPNIGVMLAGRLLQAIGASGPLVLTRSIVRDLYHGSRAAIELGRMGLIIGVVPSLAPLAGGFLEAAAGWRASFFAMLFYAAASFVLVLTLQETVKEKLTTPFSPAGILRDFGVVLKNRGYRVAVAQMSLSFCGIFSFISGSSFILQGSYGLSEIAYGIAFGCGAGAMMSGNLFGQKMLARWGAARLFRFGTALMAVGGVGMMAAVLVVPLVLGRHSALEIIVPYMIYTFGVGPLFALTMMRALHPFPDRAGAASSLLGFIQQMSAATVGALVGVALGWFPNAMPLAVVLAAVGLAAVGLEWIDRRRAKAEGRDRFIH